MENENAPEGGETNPTNEPAAVAPKVDLEAVIESRLAQMEARMLEKLADSQKPAKQALTPEQYQQLLKDNPAAAIEMAVKAQVREALNPEIQKLSTKQHQMLLDQKAEADFPLLKTDQAFQKEVTEKMREFVQNGEYSKDSPWLLRRAAEIVSLKYEVKKSRSGGKGGISGEAPNNAPKDTKAPTKKPDNFSALADVFGLSKESQERMLAKMNKKGGQ